MNQFIDDKHTQYLTLNITHHHHTCTFRCGCLFVRYFLERADGRTRAYQKGDARLTQNCVQAAGRFNGVVLWCGRKRFIIKLFQPLFTFLVYLTPFSIDTPFCNVIFYHSLGFVVTCFNRIMSGLNVSRFHSNEQTFVF